MSVRSWIAAAGVSLALFAIAGPVTGRATHVLAADPTTPSISVSGEGIITAAPDTATIQLGVSVQALSVADARNQAAAAGGAVLTAVKADGVADADAKTAQFTINPVYDNSNNQQVLRGYRVDNTLEIKIRDLNAVGKIIDDATVAGGNATVVRNISFSIENTDALLHQARLAAMANAQAKAQDYAAAAGVSLGRVMSISEQSAATPTPVRSAPVALAAAAPAPPTPIEAGTQQISVKVSVVYAIQ